ncbi:unnamed protein product [Sphagnum jensenii]|uniref:Uncharacterized protein n=1 Tax=Sphagnum jensenii TaxID=128206 RepID=A0ABP1C175_9BRYO
MILLLDAWDMLVQLDSVHFQCGTNPIGCRVIEEIPHVHEVTWKLAMLMKKLKPNMGSLNLNLLIQNMKSSVWKPANV